MSKNLKKKYILLSYWACYFFQLPSFFGGGGAVFSTISDVFSNFERI